MGLGCGPNGRVDVTDDDSIEISNLNRQFLFRQEHVKKSKADVGASIARLINPALNIYPHKHRVNTENEKIFNDDFWDGLDMVIGAVDNVHARKYVDGKCLLHKKHLFESGTLGTKCNSQMIVPYKTQSYGDSEDPGEEGVPMCTIRNYPYLIDHCIEWSRASTFESFFGESSQEFKIFLENPNAYITKQLSDKTKGVGVLKELFGNLRKYAISYESGCTVQSFVENGRKLFQELFVDQIAQLLHCFPHDYVDKDGNVFWASPKRAPYLFSFDSKDSTHFEFVKSVVTIMASVFGVSVDKSDSEIREMADKYQPPAARVGNVKIKENDKDETQEGGEEDDQIVEELVQYLQRIQRSNMKILPVEFEKDEDSNGHINFIWTSSALRARNYKIKEADFHEVKHIAGKIIPAIATTTASIVGVVGLEQIKWGLDKSIEKVKNSFINLAINLYVFSETLPPNKNKDCEMDPILFCPVVAVPPNWTSWDTLDIQGPCNLQGMIDQLKDKFSLKCSMIICGTMAAWMEGNKGQLQRLEWSVEKTFLYCSKLEKLHEGQNYILFNVSVETMEGDEATTPIVRYMMK